MGVNAGKNLVNGSILASSAAVVYTAPTSVNRVVITSATITNYTGTAADVTLWVLQNGDTRATNFMQMETYSLAANTTESVPALIGMSIDAGGTVDGLCGTATAVAITLNGNEFTT